MILPLCRALAESPDAGRIAAGMKKALEPAQPSVRTIVMTMHSADGEDIEWATHQARERLSDGDRILTVSFHPEDLKGVALLVAERQNDKTDAQWVYLPTLRRVREILPVSAYESFMGTDFSYADLGLVNLRDRTFKFLGEESIDDTPAYKIQEVPVDQRYYSRIVSWVAKATMLPLRRDFYDPGNRLWKTERIEDSAVIDGVPTLLRVRMEDKQERTSTEMRVTKVHYGVRLPDGLFDSARLSKAAQDPVWSQ